MEWKSGDGKLPYAIVAGLDDARGVYTARTLARHHVPIIGITKNAACYACRTNVCERILTANTTNEELIQILEVLGPTLGQKAVLVPCLDMSMLLISRHRDKLEKWYHIALPDPNVVEILANKAVFYRFATQNGFCIPKSYFLQDRSDLEGAIEGLTFPCALKPASSKTPLWLAHTHLKAFKILDVPELRAAVEQHRNYTDILILQDWIEGGDDSLYTSFCYLDAHSNPLVTFTSRKIRQWPPQTGDTSLAEECSNEHVLHETIRLLQSLEFRGLAFIEMKLDRGSGKFFILDPNIGRTAAWMGITEAGGVELLFTMYCDMIGTSLPNERTQTGSGPKWIYLRKDIQSAIYYWFRGKITISQWWQSLRGHKVDALLSLSDFGPFWYDLLNALYMLLEPRERQKRRG
jgi:predicted ATP-grasp superfamily ATP-dependent carboligase